eukprot:COSAG05_NODE_7147_length_850_cov_1.074567_1_plen_168_part_10
MVAAQIPPRRRPPAPPRNAAEVSWAAGTRAMVTSAAPQREDRQEATAQFNPGPTIYRPARASEPGTPPPSPPRAGGEVAAESPVLAAAAPRIAVPSEAASALDIAPYHRLAEDRHRLDRSDPAALLGKGSSADVYKGTYRFSRVDTPVAYKVLRLTTGLSESLLQQVQ